MGFDMLLAGQRTFKDITVDSLRLSWVYVGAL